MSRSCHRATFSTAAWALPRSTRARPVMRSVVIGLRLWGIALEPFCCPARNGSSASRTSVRCRWRISVASRSRPAPASAIACSSSAWRSRGTTCVETGSRSRPRRASTRSSKSGLGGRVGADGAAERPDARLRERALAGARRCGAASKAKPASLMPNVVGSAWTPWVRPTQTVSTCSRARVGERGDELARARHDDLAGRLQLQRRARCRARRRRSARSGSSARPGPALALSTSTKAATSWSVTRSRSLTASTVNVARADRLEVGGGRPVHLLAGGDLDAPPRLHARLVGPDRPDLGAGVAIDHGELGRVARLGRPLAPRDAARMSLERSVANSAADVASASRLGDDPERGDVERAAARSPRIDGATTREDPTQQPGGPSSTPNVTPPRGRRTSSALRRIAAAGPRPSSDRGLCGEVPADAAARSRATRAARSRAPTPTRSSATAPTAAGSAAPRRAARADVGGASPPRSAPGPAASCSAGRASGGRCTTVSSSDGSSACAASSTGSASSAVGEAAAPDPVDERS